MFSPLAFSRFPGACGKKTEKETPFFSSSDKLSDFAAAVKQAFYGPFALFVTA